MKHLSEKDFSAFSDISLRRIGIGILIGLLTIALSTLMLAALISRGKIGADKMTLCAGGAVFLGGLVSSVFACGKRKMLISAAITALGLLLILAIIGFLAYAGLFSVKMCLLLLIILLVSCILGSVISSFLK